MNFTKPLLTALVLFGSAAQADFTRVEAGIGVWQSEADGTVGLVHPSGVYAVDADGTLGFDEEHFGYIWLNVKHPLPLLPNLRLEHTEVDFSGTAPRAFEWVDGGVSRSYAARTASSLQVEQTDLTLYYNLLDNTAWATLDLGVDFKLMDVSYALNDVANGYAYAESDDVILPMLYLRGRVQIPATELGVEADVKYLRYDDSLLYDARLKVDYTLDFVPVVQPALELGYRIQKIRLDNDELRIRTDLDFSGFYTGVMLRF